MTDSDDAKILAAREAMAEQVAQHASMVSGHIGRSSLAEPVMAAIRAVPRHAFVTEEMRAYAYVDQPLPIGYGKTISQPFIVALMTDLLDLQGDNRVLEIGTGLGYQCAVLAQLAHQIYSVEIVGELASEAEARLHSQGYDNIELRTGDGGHGWPDHAPFDRIISTAAPELIPAALLNQLKPGGKMVIPAGIEGAQQLMLVEKNTAGLTSTQEILPVRFSPLIVTH